MQNRIDRALRTMFLRRKLRAIKARRIKYPATDDGRRRFMTDSLRPKNQPLFYILIGIGISGMTIVLLMCFAGHPSFLLAIASLGLFVLGVQGLERRS